MKFKELVKEQETQDETRMSQDEAAPQEEAPPAPKKTRKKKGRPLGSKGTKKAESQKRIDSPIVEPDPPEPTPDPATTEDYERLDALIWQYVKDNPGIAAGGHLDAMIDFSHWLEHWMMKKE